MRARVSAIRPTPLLLFRDSTLGGCRSEPVQALLRSPGGRNCLAAQGNAGQRTPGAGRALRLQVHLQQAVRGIDEMARGIVG
jgi:hypothetical protein